MTPFFCQILLIPNVAAPTATNSALPDYVRSVSNFSSTSNFSHLHRFSFFLNNADLVPTFPTFPPIQPISIQSNSVSDDISINNLNSTIPPITIDPEAIMTVPEIIRHWNYPVEIHNVVTKDGYILQLHRIPYGKGGVGKKRRSPVFLQHGLLCTSSIWLLNLPHQSAGFVLADAGFDVWLGNMRGNVYSKQHVSKQSTNPDFWKFSWQEMAQYDLPAMIDYVLNATEREELYYVGHSQGTLTMFALLSERPEYNKKIRQFHALAPVARMTHVQGLFKYLGQIYEQFSLVYTFFGDNEFLTNNIFTRLLTDIMCDTASASNPLCENFIFSLSGPNSNQFNSSRIGIYLAHNPAGTSTRNMLHFAQMIKSRRFAAFDRGKEGNIKMYGQPYPPEYSMTSMTSPLYLYYSDYDWLANAPDVEMYLMRSIPKNTLKVAMRLKEFNHNDFLWGLRARKEIYDRIVNIIKLDNRRIDLQRAMAKMKLDFKNGTDEISFKTV